MYSVNYKQALSRLSLVVEAVFVYCFGIETMLLQKYA
jgi:hypothetical protein